jgi:hypothetical protein
MKQTKHESIFSSIRAVIVGETLAKKAAAEMRPLTEDELRTVAGGPEVEVGNGN